MADRVASLPSISGNQLVVNYGDCIRRGRCHFEHQVGGFVWALGAGSSRSIGLSSSRPGASTLREKKQSLFLSSRQSPLQLQTPILTKRYHSGWRITALSDPELHFVLELASDVELQELSKILYGRSLLSPLLKSLARADGSSNYDHGEHLTEQEGRDALLGRLESRFLFLAADAKATLSGRRPTYRNVLLQVRKKLSVPCSAELSTEDMESEIFLFLLQQSSRQSIAAELPSQEAVSAMSIGGEMDIRERNWRTVLPMIMKLRGKEMLSTILKGGGAVTVSTLQRLVFKKLSGKLLVETARYQLAKEAVVKTGQVAAMLEARVAVLAAKQGLMGAAKRYITVRSTMSVLGPMLWGTLLADMLISSVGTDYTRVVRAICALAQIRLMRTYHSKDIEDLF
ncbi:hypothetical protein MPTK1_6g14240 [Marchantia polymorpha subsp. ruderalis]|uniref:Uncharacterized protein n=2 Tax=Marchantia polymorpha TaxID=3197 RepID=A0A176WNS7_MARPO|nr:hypothetical protein AXG93_2891s1500 [Marchantia polymorpha subsp. ruderalis]PTQ39098.1 hypothetical protein MARPO_0047s0078 [Marchantia polymorpha]BBN14755.1 hypothetical protein Mp_6g14240 [Marchantia polymorpha subsp. ruderalis]|eukprot:PTQ39098.1 hypothetical protein MARPO_0047s0078 [Marchantia polymorpha]